MKQVLNKTVIALSVALSTALPAKTLSVSKMDTSELFQNTLDSVEECIEYCIDGISIYMIITPFGISFNYTPNISHNTPDVLIMSHNDIRNSPWEDFDKYFGEAVAGLSEKMMQLASGQSVEMGGGRERHEGWGYYQANALKEVTAQGHPASIIMKIFGKGGLRKKGYWVGNGEDREWHSCYTYGCIEEEDSALGNSTRQELGQGGTDNMNTTDWLSDFYNGKSMNTTPDMVNSFGGNMGNMEIAANDRKLNGFIRGLSSNVNSHGAGGLNLFCKTNVTPFMPYYLSSLDFLQWRMGYPVTDLKYSKYVLNPISSDVIGATVKDNLGVKTTEHWGHLFPREGVVNNEWDSKRGLITAARAAHILNENSSTRIRYKPDDSNNGFGGWGKIFPIVGETTKGHKAAACHKNIANTGTSINETGGYAWTFWRRYNCDLETKGIHITTIKFPKPICLTPKVPD